MKTILFTVAALLALSAAGRADDGAAKKDEAKPAAVEKKDASPAKADAAKAEAPEFITFGKTKTMAPVKFPHKLHAEKTGGCAACHEGKEPLFKQEKPAEEGLKMADMYAGKACGACHDGKKVIGEKAVFAAKAGCMKCHKKAEPAKK